MLKWLAPLLTLALLAPAAPAGAAAAKRHPICGPAKARTIEKTSRLRVYSLPSRYGGRTDYVCSRYSRRVWELDDPYPKGACYSSQGCRGRTKLLVADRWVLEVSEYHGADDYVYITLRAAGARRPAAYTVVAFLHEVVLDATGAAVWIADRWNSDAGPYARRIVVEEACGLGQLDEGPGIDVNSLRVEGDEVVWTNAGERRSAVLCSF